MTPAARPAPRPPRALRPKRISVTEVATLLADPYAFHARQVLRLRKLEDLDADVGAIDYGQIVHAALAEFIAGLNAVPGLWPGDDAAEKGWEEAAARALAAQGPRPALAAFWRPRLTRIGGFVREMEAASRAGGGVAHSFCEQDGTLTLARPGGPVELRGRADRIDRLGDGTLLIFDYKTGSVPADAALRSGAAPQLPLEAAMAAEGGFGALGSTIVRALTYWKLSGGDTPGETRMPVSEPEDVAKLAETALVSLQDLVDRFLLAEAPFIARPHPGRVSRNTDYDQLSRYAEWADAEDGE